MVLKKIFCIHKLEKISFKECLDEKKNVRYSVRLYKCVKCGKEKFVDGRYDPYEKVFEGDKR